MANQLDPSFTLGSASPRRSDLLASRGLSFAVETVDIDEAALVDPNDPNPHATVERIARAKFAAFSADVSPRVLLTADTMVACGDEILGKPNSPEHLSSMLHGMSGKQLMIATAVCVGIRGEQPDVEVVSTSVMLRELDAAEIERYVETRVGMDKAAGLALQAEAKPFMQQVIGCWSNVLGMPVCAATRLLGRRIESVRDVGGGTDEPACSVRLCGSDDR